MGCGLIANSGLNVATRRGIDASAPVNWCKSTGASTGGLRTQAATHALGVCRRCDRAADASSVCRERVDLCLFFRRRALIWKRGASRSRFYRDKHGVFRVNHQGALGGDGMTQFGRALDALNIEITCAN